MANLTLRLVKGSPLTYAEVDDNFTALNDATGHFKNALINGDFRIWQEGTSFTASGSYTAEMWSMGTGSGGVATVSRQSFTLGQTEVPGEPEHFLRHDQTTGATSSPQTVQKIEGVRTYAGETVTLTFYAKVAAGTLSVTPRLIQQFDSPSSAVVHSGGSKTLTTTWSKFTETFSLSGLSGKTIGTDKNDYLQFDLLYPTSVAFTVDIAQFQLEPGSMATSFERRPVQQELALCQRYFEKSYDQGITPGTSGESSVAINGLATTDTQKRMFVDFKVPKRTVPTVVFFDSAGASGKVSTLSSAGGETNGISISNSFLYESGVDLWVITTQTGIRLGFTANARL